MVNLIKLTAISAKAVAIWWEKLKLWVKRVSENDFYIISRIFKLCKRDPSRLKMQRETGKRCWGRPYCYVIYGLR